MGAGGLSPPIPPLTLTTAHFTEWRYYKSRRVCYSITVSVCLSVCLSVTRVICVQTDKRISRLSTSSCTSHSSFLEPTTVLNVARHKIIDIFQLYLTVFFCKRHGAKHVTIKPHSTLTVWVSFFGCFIDTRFLSLRNKVEVASGSREAMFY